MEKSRSCARDAPADVSQRGIGFAKTRGMTSNASFTSPMSPHSHALADAAMARYAGGDNISFAELHDQIAPRLHRFLSRQTRDEWATQDLLQQTLLRIHTARAQYRPGTAVFPWAYAIARSVLIDSMRRSKRRLQPLSLEVGLEPATSGGPDDRLELFRAIAKLEQRLLEMPETQRVAFELLDIEGWSLGDVAESLGTTKVAAKLRAHRARAALRQALA